MSEATGWRRLDGDEYRKFRRRHAAELEAVRSALPPSVARGALDAAGADARGYPAHVMSHAAAKDAYALVWRVRGGDGDGGEPGRVVGYVELKSGAGLRCRSAPPEGASAAPHPLLESARTLGVEEAWQGPCERAAPDAAAAEAARRQAKKSSPAEESEEARKGMEEVRAGFAVEPLEAAAKKAEARWQAESARRDLKVGLYDDRAEIARLERSVVNFAFPAHDDLAGWQRVSVSAFAIPFYEGCALYRITDRRGLRSKSGYVIMPRGVEGDPPVCYLGNTTEPIHRFNAQMQSLGRLRITAETAGDYLVFFCRFVYGEEGAFLIAEKESDFRWLSGQYDDGAGEAKRRRVVELLEPVRLLKPAGGEGEVALDSGDAAALDSGDEAALDFGGEEALHCSAFVSYGRHLYYSRFEVARAGAVTMREDSPCVMDLPISPVAFDFESDFVLRPRSGAAEATR